MQDEPLYSYIVASLAEGMSADSIRQTLLSAAWSGEQVEEGLVRATQAAMSVNTPPISMQAQGVIEPLSTQPFLDSALHWVFRIGFALIFLVNSIIAFVKPGDFIHLLENFPVATATGHLPALVLVAGINDLILGILILSGRWKQLIWAWAGAWLALVAIVKLFSLI